MAEAYSPATRPTMYFIGVTTRQSSINQVFPRWAERLRLGECELRGMDFPLHAEPALYRAAVEFIKRDPLSLGALVTTHKIDLCHACRDQFDELDPFARSLGEIGSIYKRDGRLHGRAVDPWTVGYALDAFLPRGHWRDGAEALILGAGGAGTALSWRLNHPPAGASRPRRIHIVDPVGARLDKLRQLSGTWSDVVPLAFYQAADAGMSDALASCLPARSLVVNATGLGKDAPGSPLGRSALFPEHGVAWEFNYRGNLVFLEQARAQQHARQLRIEDGWTYFLHGWTRVMADVFNVDIPTHGPGFEELGRIAAAVR